MGTATAVIGLVGVINKASLAGEGDAAGESTGGRRFSVAKNDEANENAISDVASIAGAGAGVGGDIAENVSKANGGNGEIANVLREISSRGLAARGGGNVTQAVGSNY